MLHCVFVVGFFFDQGSCDYFSEKRLRSGEVNLTVCQFLNVNVQLFQGGISTSKPFCDFTSLTDAAILLDH